LPAPQFGDRFIEVEHRYAGWTSEDDGPASACLGPLEPFADLVTAVASPEQPGALLINGRLGWGSALQPRPQPLCLHTGRGAEFACSAWSIRSN
jgi:hypothetical protein